MLLRILEKFAFLLCLATQGLYVKLRIEKLPEAAGAREGESGSSQMTPIRILTIGDSAAAGVGADDQEQALIGNLVKILESDYSVSWKLWAKSGETTKTKLRKLEALNEHYDYIVVSLGVNDVTTPIREKSWIKQQIQLIELLQSRSKPNKIILGSLPPIHEFFALPNPLRYLMARRGLRFTAALKLLCENYRNVTVLELPSLSGDDIAMASDGFHPGPGVYRAWAQAVVSEIAEDQYATSTEKQN